MNEIWIRIVENLSDRVSGPMKLRLFLQPVMAAVFAIMAGIKDAKVGRPPYFQCLRRRWRGIIINGCSTAT